jgi:hypothetical protein
VFDLPPFAPLEEGQHRFLMARLGRVLPLSRQLARLRERLLGIGGLEVVLPRYDEFPDHLRQRDDYYTARVLERGRTWPAALADLEPGQANSCHTNVARLHMQARGAIASGWALADDGLWREHSWIVARSATGAEALIETTVSWLVYHGYELDREEAGRFLRDELGPNATLE